MKSPNHYLLAALFVIAILLLGCENTNPTNYTQSNYFNVGDTLYPDYACSDTLIVINAKGLNRDMALIEQGMIYASDSSIDSVIHLYCFPKVLLTQ